VSVPPTVPRIGVSLPQFTDDPDIVISGAKRAEDSGLDSIWLFDHLWPLTGGKRRPIFECWTTLAHVAAVTEKIGIGTMVTRSSLRHPAVLAKMAATVGAIAPGRLTVCIGSGDELSRDENESFGVPYFDEDRVDQLLETVRVVRNYLAGETPALPLSPRVPEIPPVWIAGRSDEIVEATAEADGWNAWAGTVEEFAQDAARVRTLGRPGLAITWAGLVVVNADKPPLVDSKRVQGPAAEVGASLARFAEAGAEEIVCVMPDAERPTAFEVLGEQVAPLVREYVVPRGGIA
jgi:alkanesulfonate monooxygenase SsuD/methylene tetrahydromethanopterin reductase-like flavin-dependent oxidoreductase (luciferase family)